MTAACTNAIWASEVRATERELDFGKKVVDTKLGTRSNMFCSPFFQLALDEKSRENEGEVLVGTLGWTGNWRNNGNDFF